MASGHSPLRGIFSAIKASVQPAVTPRYKITSMLELANNLVDSAENSHLKVAGQLDHWMDRHEIGFESRYILATRILFGIGLRSQKFQSIEQIATAVNAMRWASPFVNTDLKLGRLRRPTNPPQSPEPPSKPPDLAVNLSATLFPKVLLSESFHPDHGVLAFALPAGKDAFYRG